MWKNDGMPSLSTSYKSVKFNRLSLIWLLPALAFFCLGWADSWESLRATAATVTSVQAEFVQEKHLPILAKPLISKGVFYYQTPESLRWEYQSPVKSILTMHNGRIRRFLDGPSGIKEESGAGMDAMQMVVQEITNWLAGRFDQSTVFTAELQPDGRIELLPREEAFRKVIQRIVLNLAPQPGTIDSVTIYESRDAFTRMTFSHTVLNERIEEAVFQVENVK